MEIKYLDQNNLNNINLGDLDVTIGAYDGIHEGHVKVINELVNHKISKHTAVITFLKHPDIYLHKRDDAGMIELISEKAAIFSALGVDYLIVLDNSVLELTYLEFNNLLKKINVKRVVVGEDFVYGKGASGNINTIKADFILTSVSLVLNGESKVSSSVIRDNLRSGNLDEVNKILNHHFIISGNVIHGERIGSLIGFKTANLLMNEKYRDLRVGVYVVKVIIDDKEYDGICNYGYNPTINKQQNPRLEVHIFDYDEELYGRFITIKFIKFMRDEMKFNNKEELVKQIEEDIKKVKGEYL